MFLKRWHAFLSLLYCFSVLGSSHEEETSQLPSAAEVSDCPKPDPPNNGHVQVIQLKSSTVAHFTCSEGFIIQPTESENITCANNHWARAFPVCVPACPKLDAPQNGIFQLQCSYLSCEANLTCHGGFKPYPASKLSCEGENGWHPFNGSIRCIRDNTLGAAMETAETSSANISDFSESMTILDSDVNETTTALATTEARGVDCPAPQGFPHMVSSIHEGVVHYRCQFMYLLVGKPTRVCLQSGEWTGDVPMCLHVNDPQGNFTSMEVMQYWKEIFKLYPSWTGDYKLVNITINATLEVQYNDLKFNHVDFILHDGAAKVTLRAEPDKKSPHLIFTVLHVDVVSDVFTQNTNWSFRAILSKQGSNWTLQADWFSGILQGFKELTLYPASREGSIVRHGKVQSHDAHKVHAEFAKALALGVFFGGIAIGLAAVGAYIAIRRYQPFSGGPGSRIAGFENPVYNQQVA